MKTKLFQLIKKKEMETGRNWTYEDVATESGVSERLIHRWINTEPRRFDADSIEKLCRFFDCEVGDLLHLVEVSE